MCKNAIHIGFIDFTFFKDYPEFCATYMMINTKNHNIYSSKFVLKVIELNIMVLIDGRGCSKPPHGRN